MQIKNTERFNQVVEAAKAKAVGQPRWINAIEKAAEGLMGAWIVTELVSGLVITTENGTYHANGVCQCKAFANGQPCKHRAAAKLVENYNQAVALAASSPRDERAGLITDIKATWSRRYPGVALADALMSRFRCNKLEMLAADNLTRIQTALAA